jgi:hypothetical protein
MIRKVSQYITELAYREAIRDCIYVYSCDPEALRAAFWPDARMKADLFSGNAEEFVAFAIPNLKTYFDQVAHLLGNTLIRLDGDKAVAETYLYGYHCYAAEEPKRDLIMSGRYLDRFEKRDDEWRLSERTVLIDWFRFYADSGDFAVGPLGMQVDRGERAPTDKSYALFTELRVAASADVQPGE